MYITSKQLHVSQMIFVWTFKILSHRTKAFHPQILGIFNILQQMASCLKVNSIHENRILSPYWMVNQSINLNGELYRSQGKNKQLL